MWNFFIYDKGLDVSLYQVLVDKEEGNIHLKKQKISVDLLQIQNINYTCTVVTNWLDMLCTNYFI